MKFLFKNLGPIREAELELGDLTIIAGRNNTGKTYVAYTLYGFLSWWLGSPMFQEELFGELRQKTQPSDKLAQVPDMEKIAETVLEEDQAKWFADREALNLMRKVFMREITRNFSENYLSQVFGASDIDFGASSEATRAETRPDGSTLISVKFSPPLHTLEVVLEEQFPEDAPSQTWPSAAEDEFTITYIGNEICIRRSKVGGKSLSPVDISYDLSFLFFLFLFPELPDPFILSAERFGLSLFYKELAFTQSRLSDFFRGKMKDRDKDSFRSLLAIDKRAGQYALPIKDNIDYTRGISEFQKQRSEIHDSKLFNDVRDMMGGYYRSSGDDIRFISKARKERRFDIPLHIASSSVRGLSDLYFFLRHVAKKNQLLIIDEPESHLDTANQIILARLLARAVHAGLKVLITTHSDYIVKEINNLLMLSKDFKDKPRVLKKHGYSEHDFLNPDSVRAYVAENNSLTRCTIDRFGIDMPVFDTTIDTINRVSSELEVRLTHEGEE